MRERLTKTRWLVIIVAVLGLVGFWGWRHLHEDHDHDDHAMKPNRRPRSPAR